MNKLPLTTKLCDGPDISELYSELYRLRKNASEIRMIREALKVERAMFYQYFLEIDQHDLMVAAWDRAEPHVKDECLKLAEFELRAKGVIE